MNYLENIFQLNINKVIWNMAKSLSKGGMTQ